jgi:DNA-binding SARP family transcriptional activator
VTAPGSPAVTKAAQPPRPGQAGLAAALALVQAARAAAADAAAQEQPASSTAGHGARNWAGDPASPDRDITGAAGGTADQADPPVRLLVLGPLQVTACGREVPGGMRKARELLAFLAVHPGGASGEALSAALWPDADAGQAAARRNLALRKARGLLRAATGLAAPAWITRAAGRYRLDPALTATDLQDFDDALAAARRAGSDAGRLAACRAAVALYRGEVAEGAGYEWAEPHAEAVRRRALDAWTAIAAILQPAAPARALDALEAALPHDPYNEYLYQRIMRLQAAAGHPEAVRRTLVLLQARLAELGTVPAAQTRQVAAALLSDAAPAARL